MLCYPTLPCTLLWVWGWGVFLQKLSHVVLLELGGAPTQQGREEEDALPPDSAMHPPLGVGVGVVPSEIERVVLLELGGAPTPCS